MTSVIDALRRETTLARFSWAAQDHPDSRALTRELRRELNVTASDVGWRRALGDLGSPRALAQGYIDELPRPVPRWSTGAVWGGIALAFALYTAMAYGFGTMDTLSELAGPEGLTVHRRFLGADFTYTGGPDELGMTGSFGWGWAAVHLAIFVVPFALGSRIWRLRFRP